MCPGIFNDYEMSIMGYIQRKALPKLGAFIADPASTVMIIEKDMLKFKIKLFKNKSDR